MPFLLCYTVAANRPAGNITGRHNEAERIEGCGLDVSGRKEQPLHTAVSGVQFRHVSEKVLEV